MLKEEVESADYTTEEMFSSKDEDTNDEIWAG